MSGRFHQEVAAWDSHRVAGEWHCARQWESAWDTPGRVGHEMRPCSTRQVSAWQGPRDDSQLLEGAGCPADRGQGCCTAVGAGGAAAGTIQWMERTEDERARLACRRTPHRFGFHHPCRPALARGRRTSAPHIMRIRS